MTHTQRQAVGVRNPGGRSGVYSKEQKITAARLYKKLKSYRKVEKELGVGWMTVRRMVKEGR